MIVNLVVAILLLALFAYLITLLPIPAPFGSIIHIILVVVAILWTCSAFGLFTILPVPHIVGGRL